LSISGDDIENMHNYYSPLKTAYNIKYDDQPRINLLEFIAKAPDRILEIGCGTGATGAAIKEKYPKTCYIGIEIDEKAAALARTRLDYVIQADIDRINIEDLNIEKQSIDIIIFADVLEHLYDPWKVLHIMHDYLKPDGTILASIPNVQNFSLILHLIEGNWTYENCGLLDATHIRFFTLHEISKLFTGTGYALVNCVSTLQYQIEEEGWPRDLDFGKFVIKGVTKEEAVQFFAFQYIIIAKKITKSSNI
jgi:O-antigen biosynthesis protein